MVAGLGLARVCVGTRDGTSNLLLLGLRRIHVWVLPVTSLTEWNVSSHWTAPERRLPRYSGCGIGC